MIAGCDDGAHHAVDDLLDVDAVGERLVREQHPVAQHVAADVVDVLRQQVPTAAQQRERAAGREQGERRARAGAVRDERRELGEAGRGRLAGREHEAHRVVEHRVVDEDLVGRGLQRGAAASGVRSRSRPTAGRTLMRRAISASSPRVG